MPQHSRCRMPNGFCFHLVMIVMFDVHCPVYGVKVEEDVGYSFLYVGIVACLNDFSEKLLLTHEYGANGFLDALRHATDMERGVIRSLRAGLLMFEKHGSIATY